MQSSQAWQYDSAGNDSVVGFALPVKLLHIPTQSLLCKMWCQLQNLNLSAEVQVRRAVHQLTVPVLEAVHKLQQNRPETAADNRSPVGAQQSLCQKLHDCCRVYVSLRIHTHQRFRPRSACNFGRFVKMCYAFRGTALCTCCARNGKKSDCSPRSGNRCDSFVRARSQRNLAIVVTRALLTISAGWIVTSRTRAGRRAATTMSRLDRQAKAAQCTAHVVQIAASR